MPASEGHCEGPCSDHRLPANLPAPLTLPGAHRGPVEGIEVSHEALLRHGQMSRKETLEAGSAQGHVQPPREKHCGRCPARGPGPILAQAPGRPTLLTPSHAQAAAKQVCP